MDWSKFISIVEKLASLPMPHLRAIIDCACYVAELWAVVKVTTAAIEYGLVSQVIGLLSR